MLAPQNKQMNRQKIKEIHKLILHLKIHPKFKSERIFFIIISFLSTSSWRLIFNCINKVFKLFSFSQENKNAFFSLVTFFIYATVWLSPYFNILTFNIFHINPYSEAFISPENYHILGFQAIFFDSAHFLKIIFMSS